MNKVFSSALIWRLCSFPGGRKRVSRFSAFYHQALVSFNVIVSVIKPLLLPLFCLPLCGFALADDIEFSFENGLISLSPAGDEDSEWFFEFSTDLKSWDQLYELPPVFPGETSTVNLNFPDAHPRGFFRAVQTGGFYDPRCLRTLELTFEDNDWLSQLVANYSTGEEI